MQRKRSPKVIADGGMPDHTICLGPAADSAVQYPSERPRSFSRKANDDYEAIYIWIVSRIASPCLTVI